MNCTQLRVFFDNRSDFLILLLFSLYQIVIAFFIQNTVCVCVPNNSITIAQKRNQKLSFTNFNTFSTSVNFVISASNNIDFFLPYKPFNFPIYIKKNAFPHSNRNESLKITWMKNVSCLIFLPQLIDLFAQLFNFLTADNPKLFSFCFLPYFLACLVKCIFN